jgi:hypothetical protein
VKALSCFWNELPVIASGVKSELKHSEGTGIPRFTIRLRCSENAMRIFPSAADNKFTNAMCRVRLTFRILGSKAFIIVIVPVDHHIRSRVVQHLPQWASTVFEPAPGGSVAFGKVFVGAVGIREVAHDKDRTRYFVDQFCGSLCSGQIIAASDVSRTDQDGILVGRFRRVPRLLLACEVTAPTKKVRQQMTAAAPCIICVGIAWKKFVARTSP